MKDCEKLEMSGAGGRKAYIDRQNRLIRKNLRTPELSLPGSSILSHDISLHPLSLGTESRNSPGLLGSRKPSRVLHECTTREVSAKDQKILELMALRRESQMEEREVALHARNVWEAERTQRARKAERNKRTFLEFLAKKKEIEELEKAIKRNYRDENLRQEKLILELRISKKHEAVERRKKELSLQRKLKPETVTTNYQLMLHRELKKQKQEKEETEKAAQMLEFEMKERRSKEKLKRVLMERCERLREDSLKEELRLEAAKSAREELNRRREDERVRQQMSSEREQWVRAERVRWTKEWRKKIVSEKNERERQKHAVMYSKVKEEEKEQVNRAKRKIQEKDVKTKVFREKREEAIARSRSDARKAAELRQKMRLTYEL